MIYHFYIFAKLLRLNVITFNFKKLLHYYYIVLKFETYYYDIIKKAFLQTLNF